MSAALPHGWLLLPEERLELYSPVGLQFVDDLTGGAPVGRVRHRLEIGDGAGGWAETLARTVVTPSGVLTYPALGRRRDVTAGPTRYRVVLEFEFYVPSYRSTAEAVEFDAHPYDDTHPPAALAALPQTVFLYPAANYPFPPHAPVVRGRVQDAAGAAVAWAEVSHGLIDHAISDRRGEFALPIRGVAEGVAFTVDAFHPPSGAVGSVTGTLPAAQSHSQTLTLT